MTPLYPPGSVVAVDTETTGLSTWHGDRPFAFSFCSSEEVTAYIEFPVDPFTRKVLYNKKPKAFKRLRQFFRDPSILKVFHNAAFDVRMIESAGLAIHAPGGRVISGGDFDDTILMAHAANNQEMTYQLKPLAKRYGGIDDDDLKELKKSTQACRRMGKKAGWELAIETKTYADGSQKVIQHAAADYWMGRAILDLPPEDRGGFDLEVAQVAADFCEEYAVTDAVRTMFLWLMYTDIFREDEKGNPPGAGFIYRTVEKPIWYLLYETGTRGIVYDIETGRKEREEHGRIWIKLRQELRDLAGDDDFNPDSAPQLAKLLFEKLKLKPGDYTDKGKPSTGKKSLEMMLNEPVVNTLTHYRSSGKAYTDFFGKYEHLCTPDIATQSGCMVLHPGFKQTGTATGRMSCSNPNLQQVPDPTKSASLVKLKVRHTLVPRPGYVFIAADFSNQEMRIFAHGSQDKMMLDAFAAGRDVHGELTNHVWGGEGNALGTRYMARSLRLYGDPDEAGSSPPEIRRALKELGTTPEKAMRFNEAGKQELAATWMSKFGWLIMDAEKAVGVKVSRGVCKQVSFLKLFGGGAARLAFLLQISKDEANEILSYYDQAIPSVKDFSSYLVSKSKQDGFIYCAFGRKLSAQREFEYRAVNHYVQGSAATQMKIGMLNIERFVKEHKLPVHIVLQVHDELCLEVKKSRLTARLVDDLMREMSDHHGVLSIDVPAVPDICWHNWQEGTSFEKIRNRK